jgi:hypothetical protein
VSVRIAWCGRSGEPAGTCAEHASGHRDLLSDLGSEDEPRSNGALVLVWAGDYRRQEVWVASGSNIGNWYCLGGEYGRPKVWDPPRQEMWDRRPQLGRPFGTIPQHPDWSFVLTRGPVSLLSYDNSEACRDGWRNGRRRLYEEIEALAEDDSGADETPVQ